MTESTSERPLGTANGELVDSQARNHTARAIWIFTLQAVRAAEGIVNDFMYRDMNTAAQALLGHDRKDLIGDRAMASSSPYVT